MLSRREFIGRTAGALPAVGVARGLAAAEIRGAFSFVLLGDLHFDRLNHHDHDWLRANYPNDVRQVENYSRLTRDVIPKLFATLRETVAEEPGAFVLQVGDLMEGLCGTEERAVRQNRDAIAMIRGAQLGVPFLSTKGNHDITGPGAPEAFRSVFHPFIAEQCSVLDRGAKTSQACCSFRYAETLFCCFDAYDKESLGWLEATLAKRTERRAVYAAEAPWVKHFEYADLPGYAVIRVNGANVEARLYSGTTGSVWKSVRLSDMLPA